MMERRIGIWAAIFFLVIASRGCSGDVSVAEEARLELARSIGDDAKKAIKDHWLPNSLSDYKISQKLTIRKGSSESKTIFRKHLSELDIGKNAETKVSFSSDKCLLVEATQDSHPLHSTFLYQLILDGDDKRPRVKRAFILGGQNRETPQHEGILYQLKSSIEDPDQLWGILCENPVLVLQVLSEGGCKPILAEAFKTTILHIYKTNFLLLFGRPYKLTVTSSFQGDVYIQFTGYIESWIPVVRRYKLWMAATVVEVEGHDKVQSIHIIVEKVTEDSSKTAADPLSAGASHSAKASRIEESRMNLRKRKPRGDTDKTDFPSEKSKKKKK